MGKIAILNKGKFHFDRLQDDFFKNKFHPYLPLSPSQGLTHDYQGSSQPAATYQACSVVYRALSGKKINVGMVLRLFTCWHVNRVAGISKSSSNSLCSEFLQ